MFCGEATDADFVGLYNGTGNLRVFKHLEEPDVDSIYEIGDPKSEVTLLEGSEISTATWDMHLAPKLCHELQIKFAKNAASFVQCAIINARPISVCLECVESYNSTVHSYQDLMEASQNDTKCRNVFVSKDKLEIIETMYGNVARMWTRGNCNNCYETDGSGSPDLSVVSNQTLNFMNAAKKVRKCFEGIKLLGGTNDTCTDCKELYEHLGSIFDSISRDAVNNETAVVCADVMDTMNVTHNIWNSQLKCKLFGTSVGYALVVLTGCLSALPVLFYLAAKILSNVETIHLVLPKRKQYVQDSTRLQM